MTGVDGTRWLLACVSIVCVAGCLEADATQCDGYVCPSYMVCDVAHGGCVLADQLARCEGAVQHDECSAATIEDGRCYDGVCLPAGCGNGLVDPEEACDDGNTTPGDGCSLDCLSDEECGSGRVDLIKGEVCDDADGDLVSGDGCAQCQLEVERWRQPEPAAREDVAVAFDSARRRVVLFGGRGVSTHDETWEWDGAGWRLVEGTVRPPARFYHAMAYDAHRGVVVMFGGNAASVLGDTWEFDGVRWTEVHPPTSPEPRYRHALAYDEARKQVVMFGGVASGQGRSNETWTYDGTTWTLQTPAISPPALGGSAMAYDATRKYVVLYGGATSGAAETRTWIWNGLTWQSMSQDTPPSSRAGHAMTYDPASGEVIMTGGLVSSAFADDTWIWTGTEWSQLAFPLAPVTGAGLAFDGESVIRVHGRTPGGRISSTHRRGGGAWEEVVPPARGAHALAYDSVRGEIVLFGGLDEETNLRNDTWIRRGGGWKLAASGGPPQHEYHAMAFDRARGVVVLIGHRSATETWEWDGTAWSVKMIPGPAARESTAMAYDALRNNVVLFGGLAGGDPSGETWVYDGTAWTLQQVVSAPPPRQEHSMAYDAEREQVVLAGGSDDDGILGDTWVWDGVSWSQVASFPPRARHAMCYHPVARATYVVGGYNGTELAETWRWDGAAWSRVASPIAPPPRSNAACAFDEARNELVVHGGDVTAPTDETWTLRFEGLAGESASERCELDVDADGDGVVGCADPDCWGYCTPGCVRGEGCDPGAPRCGDHACAAGLETALNCPADCAAAVVCGDFRCDTEETTTSCPGDCL